MAEKLRQIYCILSMIFEKKNARTKMIANRSGYFKVQRKIPTKNSPLEIIE